MAKQHTPHVVFQPATARNIQKGINRLVEAIRPTLGPRPRLTAVARASSGPPELLDSGGLIARRILELRDPDEDTGAMLLRQLLWQLHEQVGDGTATAAVLFQSIYNQGVTYVTAGGNPMRLRHFLEEGLQLILAELSGLTRHLEGKENLARVAESVCYDPALARLMGEIFDIIGEHGRLEIRTGRGRDLEREYVEGMYWESPLLSREMITDPAKLRANLENAAFLMTDRSIEEPQELVPVLTTVLQAKIPALLVVAANLSPAALSLLLSNRKPDSFQVAAVKAPGYGEDQAAALQDMAILTGGRPLLTAAGDSLSRVALADLGRARRAWADRSNFGFSGGKGDARTLRRHIATLRAAFEGSDNAETRKKLQQRLGKLLGGSATLWIGAATESELNTRRDLAERTAETLRGAIMEGVLPGGGMALLACAPLLAERLSQATGPDERAAYRILLAALEAPLRTIVSNAGYDASDVMAQLKTAGPGRGFDVTTGQIVSLEEAGIFDVTTVQKAAVRGAIATAALALTVDVLVHHKNPVQAIRP